MGYLELDVDTKTGNENWFSFNEDQKQVVENYIRRYEMPFMVDYENHIEVYIFNENLELIFKKNKDGVQRY